MAHLKSMDLPEPVPSCEVHAPPAKNRWWIWLLAAVLLLTGIWYYRGAHSRSQADSSNANLSAAAAGGAGGKGAVGGG